MANIVIVFGSTTGNTEEVARLLGQSLDSKMVFDISNITVEELSSSDLLVLGVSTWGDGELQDDWSDHRSKLKSSTIQGKKVAIFGLGDQEGYPDTFVDAMRDLADDVQQAGGTIIGSTSTEGYSFSGSRAVIDGKFLGLVLDVDNQPQLTEQRIHGWAQELRKGIT
jgi:flavodoxin I